MSRMTREEKGRIAESLAERLASVSAFYVVDAKGLNTGEVQAFRKRCVQAGVAYQVVKNTLIKKALEKLQGEVDYADFSDTVLREFSGILFTSDAGSTPAKVIKAFRKQENVTLPQLKGASVDQMLFIGEEHLDTLSKLKSKAELIGDMLALLQAPIIQLAASIQSSKQQLGGILKALMDRKAHS